MGWFWADSEPAKVIPPHPVSSNSAKPPPSCPMHNKLPSPVTAPPVPSATTASSDSACPYKSPISASTTTPSASASNVLSKLNPLNYMPRVLDNTRGASQTVALDVDRETSTIPRGDGSGTTWEYPSPQQMYNAMLKKGYTDTPAEDVPAMVAVHNFLNEGAWGEILGWEARFGRGLKRGWEICRRGEENAEQTAELLARRERLEATNSAESTKGEPSLLRFLGRPDEPTPKARMMQALGWAFPATYGTEPPFDRHDWYVSREGPDGQSKEVRYVIDYYSGPPEENGMPVFYLDVRPAVDGPTAACERLLRWGGDVWWRASGASVREQMALAKAARA